MKSPAWRLACVLTTRTDGHPRREARGVGLARGQRSLAGGAQNVTTNSCRSLSPSPTPTWGQAK